MTTEKDLVNAALKARENAYVPYSKFKVGAALEAKNGKIYYGCNVENASFGLCNCAERTAFFSAMADGCKPGDFLKLAVVADTSDVTSPCGACRQVIFELGGENLEVFLANTSGKIKKTSPSELLPGAFSSADL